MRDQPIGENLTRLSDTMRAIHRLRFCRWVPPRIENEHVFGGREVQPEAAGLQADQKKSAVCIVLELFHRRLAVSGSAVQIFVCYAAAIQAIANDPQKTRELGEHQCLMPFVENLAQLFQEHVQLGAGIAGALRVEQAWMTSGLPQAQQRFQHLDLGLRQTLVLNPLEQRVAVVLAQLVVELALDKIHFTMNGLLAFGWQFAGHLLFGSAQDERPQRLSQHSAGLFVWVAHGPARNSERTGSAKHAGVKKLKKSPKFTQVVLDRRAA